MQYIVMVGQYYFGVVLFYPYYADEKVKRKMCACVSVSSSECVIIQRAFVHGCMCELE